MKPAFTKTLMLTAFVVLSACSKGGDGGGNNNPGVAASPGLPQGQVVATGYPGTYCNVSAATNQVYTQYCANATLNPALGGGTTAVNAAAKIFTCELEAERGSSQLPMMSGLVTFYGGGRIALRSLFLGRFNWGGFGETYVSLSPGDSFGRGDTITIGNDGFDKNLHFSQSGFAGYPVRAQVSDDEGSISMSVACSPQVAAARPIVARPYTRYTCRGVSDLYGGKKENVNISFALDANMLNAQLNIADGVTATVSGSASLEDAIITFTSQGIGTQGDHDHVTMVSSAYLKSTTKVSSQEIYSKLNLTCGPE